VKTSPIAAILSAWSATATPFGAVVGIGIDLVDVAVLEGLLTSGGPAFRDSVWTETEQAEAEGSTERLAGRWAAKEAVMKALQCGIGETEPLDIEIATAPGGEPAVVLHGAAKKVARSKQVTAWHVSLSHEHGWATAIAIAERNPTQTLEGDNHV
jgi:holo-[acyl-carrier protein] synthase